MMADSNFISFHLVNGSTDSDVRKFLEKDQHFKFLKRYWLNPFNNKHAVAICSNEAAAELEKSVQNVNVNMAPETETSSVIVIINNCDGFGLLDKLKLLFQWKKNGGSKVKSVIRTEKPSIFEVEFAGGWFAVLNVCKNEWKMPQIDLTVVSVTPYFKSFGKQSNSEDPSSSVAKEASFSDSSKYATTNRSQGSTGSTQGQGYRNSVAGGNKFNDPQDAKLKLYLERFGPDSANKGHVQAEKNYLNAHFELRKEITPSAKVIPFPNVLDFLNNSTSGLNIKFDIEEKFHCLIFKGLEKKTDGTNFKVTLLVTAYIDNINIHLVQGNAKDINVDAALHIAKSKFDKKPAHQNQRSSRKTIYVSNEDVDRQLEDELKTLSNQTISTLAISLSSDLYEILAVDVLAENLLKKLLKIFKGNSSKHIFLCEDSSRALFQTYHYFLLKRAKIQAFGKIDEKIWKDISHQDFYPDHLSKKIKIAQSVKNTLSKTCLVYLPISQNLDPHSCPYHVQGVFGLENPMKYLQSNMTEEELNAFCVGNTYALRLPASVPNIVYLYCTQNWTFDVAKSIQDSLSACLDACSTFKDPEVYIYPPGIFPGGTSYPVMFTAQKCLHALRMYEQRLQKINTLYLVVPEKKYYDAFGDLLGAKSSSSPLTISSGFFSLGKKKFEYKPESLLEIYGKKRETEDAFKKLEEILQHSMEHNTVEKDLDDDCIDHFIKNLQASPPSYVNVSSCGKKVKVTGLTRSVVTEFNKQHAKFFKSSPCHNSDNSYNGKTGKGDSTDNSSNSRRQAFFEWSSINNAKEFNKFNEKETCELEEKFQQNPRGATANIRKWTVDFKSMVCCQISSHKGKQTGGRSTRYLIRTERIKDMKLSKGSNNEVKDYDKWLFPLKMLTEKNVTVIKIFKIDNEKLGQRFEYAATSLSSSSSSSTSEKVMNLWHPIHENWASKIACYGFQELFSCHCGENEAVFCRDPTVFLETGIPQVLLLCDVVYNDFTLSKNIGDKEIHLKMTKMSDTHIRPKYSVQVRMK